jgi:hypothetical protein
MRRFLVFICHQSHHKLLVLQTLFSLSINPCVIWPDFVSFFLEKRQKKRAADESLQPMQ